MAGVRLGLIAVWLVALALVTGPLGWFCRAGSPVIEGLARRTCRFLLAVLRIRVQVLGRPGPEQTARLVVANHVSWIDILVLGSLEPLCFLAKREVGLWPIIGTFARLKGAVFVDRTRRRSIPAANAAMADRLRTGRSVVLFPEGTTHDGTQRGRFLTSHLACLRDRSRLEPSLDASEVQAVALAYSDPVASWIGDASLLPHLWAVASGRGFACAVVFGAPMTVRPGYDRKALGRDLQSQMEVLVSRGSTLNAVGRVRTEHEPSPAEIGGPVFGAMKTEIQDRM
ncbi:lysophospholipid acyltransferase family protein [Lichenifustis flavocetrariae]|uniref:1-acyl-sn-glycerol-3-phosphate acyltransferase n=1 Tax=Lichenifustis flavocetrariae TaxID=2949735 RepID=A0AA42CJ12_9HYPH|nr:lysophospholipid acyltransferase family protein [Lichenifustis flavocetrariae]MCW6507486.1 1-acyl-sn-glycerol-3-phosphate acyltransferase [Lichenifustis flavocetrariae]